MAKIFVSYSRKDIEFAKRLTAELTKSELDYWIDWEGIPPTVDWWREIEKGIEEADVFLFLISPDSAKSKICGQEIDTAVENGKRIIPIVVREIEWEDTPPQLGHLNYIFFSRDDDFNTALKKLMTGIQTDYEWAATHRRLQVKALDWERNNKERGFLLRGKDLNDAETELAHNTSKEPHPTDLQREYVFESRKATDRQRRTITSVSIVGVIALALLAVFGFYQAGQATNNAATAQANLVIAQTAQVDAQNKQVLADNNAATAVANEQEALRQSEISHVGELAAQADLQRDKDFQVSLLLGVEAYKGAEAIPGIDLTQQNNALFSNSLTNPQLKLYLNGHTDRVDSIAFSPFNGEILATGSWDKTVIFWDPETGEQIGEPLLHPDPVYRIAFSPDGKTLVTGGPNNVTFWDVATREKIKEEATGQEGSVSALAFSPNGQLLVVGSYDNTIIFWNANSRSPIGESLQEVSSFAVLSLAFTPDGQTLAAGGQFGNISLVDVNARQVIQRLAGSSNLFDPNTPQTGSISSLAFIEAATFGQQSLDLYLVSSSSDKSIVFWDVANNYQRVTPRLYEHLNGITSLAVSQGNRTLASGSLDNTIVVWDADKRGIKDKQLFNVNSTSVSERATGEPLNGHSKPVYGVAINPIRGTNSTIMASGDGEGTVILWDIDIASQNGRYLFEDAINNLLNQSDRFTQNELYVQLISLSLMTSGLSNVEIAMGADGNNILLGSSKANQMVSLLWDVPTSTLAPDLITSKPAIESGTNFISGTSGVAISPEGKILATARNDLSLDSQINTEVRDATILLWDKDTLDQIGELKNEQPGFSTLEEVYWVQISDIKFSPDGKLLASVRNDTSIDRADLNNINRVEEGVIVLWDVETLQPDGEPLKHTDYLTSMAFSPDGKIIAAGSDDNTIVLWDVETREPIGEPLTGHTDIVNSVAFSPDGKTLASGSSDNNIILWDVETHQQIGDVLSGHADWVYSVTFSPDGKWLASGSGDSSIILWDVATHIPFSEPLIGHKGQVLSLAFSPDGKKLYSGGALGIFVSWDLDPVTWLAQSCDRAGRNFTIEEWNIYFPNEEYRITCGQWPADTNANVTTETITLPFVPSPTPTPFPTPTATPLPQPGSLTGTISLAGDTVIPFASSLELRDNMFSHEIKGTANTDSSGSFAFENIKTGTYQVWVQLTEGTGMVLGCTDVAPSDDKWAISVSYTTVTNNGLEYGTQGSLFSLRQVQTNYLEIVKPEYTLQGFYAIRKDFTIDPNIENKLDITLICKQ